jgi:hypothetical protein
MKKFVIVTNKKFPISSQMNAVGHLCIGFGNRLEKENMHMRAFRNDYDHDVSYLTDYPLILLTTKKNSKLIELHHHIQETNIVSLVFYEVMLKESISEQEKTISDSEPKDLSYVAVGMFGETSTVDTFTKKFSLLQ